MREERVGVKPVVSSQCDNGELSVVKKKKEKKRKNGQFPDDSNKVMLIRMTWKGILSLKREKKIHFKKHPMTRSQVFLTMAYYQV